MAEFDMAALAVEEQYKLMSGSIIPRPIALTSTLGPDGPNLAPFSFFQCVAVSPPMVIISCSPKTGPKSGGSTGQPKDTVANLRELPEFVVHIVDYDQREQMNMCALDFERGVNEAEVAGFELVPSTKVAPLRIPSCRVAFECRLVEIQELGTLPYSMILGEVVHTHVHDNVVNERLHIDPGELDALGRLAGTGGYTRITDRFVLPFLHPPGSPPPAELVEKLKRGRS